VPYRNEIGFLSSRKIKAMTQIIIDNKKYVLLPEKEYKTLQRKAALSIKPDSIVH